MIDFVSFARSFERLSQDKLIHLQFLIHIAAAGLVLADSTYYSTYYSFLYYIRTIVRTIVFYTIYVL